MSGLLQLAQSYAGHRPGLGDGGQTAVEYALLVTLIAVVIVAAVALLGGNVHVLYNFAVTCASAPNAANCP